MNIERSVRSILATEYRPIEAQAYARHHLDIFLTHAAQFMSVRMYHSLAENRRGVVSPYGEAGRTQARRTDAQGRTA